MRRDIDEIKARLDGMPEEEAPAVNPHLLISPEDVHSSADTQEPVSIQDVSAELIRKALERHGGRRKPAAEELGISERTLYRKIKELDIR